MATFEDGAKHRPPLLRFLPIMLILLGFVAFFALGLNRYFGCEALQQHRAALMDWVGRHAVLAPIAYLVIYALVTALSLPVASLITVVGGFVFGVALGTSLVVLGATAGAAAVFLAARTALADSLRARAGSQIQKMQDGFSRNAVSYMIFLRLVPIFPFWLVNLAPAILGVRFSTFLWTTMIGIVPGTAVYVYLGSSVGSVVAASNRCLPSGPTLTHALVGLGLLGCLSLVPALYRKFKRAHG